MLDDRSAAVRPGGDRAVARGAAIRGAAGTEAVPPASPPRGRAGGALRRMPPFGAVLVGTVLAAVLLAAVCVRSGVATAAETLPPDATWQAIRGDIVGDAAITDGEGIVTVGAPYRADDAAVVPIDIAATLPGGRRVRTLTLVVDENPSPVAATFTFGEERPTLRLSTRLRINSYSYVRAIVEADDGTRYMTARYVKASGGCSAPALKDEEAALANLGKMKMRYPPPATPVPTAVVEPDGKPIMAQVMIRHPNYSGLQMNPVTMLYIPARFVTSIEVSQDGERLLSMEGGISLSEDPTIAFEFVPKSGDPLDVTAVDTEGSVFSGAFPLSDGAG